MYCTMGWMGAFLALFLLPYLGWEGLALIAAGGVFYTVRKGNRLKADRSPALQICTLRYPSAACEEVDSCNSCSPQRFGCPRRWEG